MDGSRQEGSSLETGRVNQKRRTRAALVDAARDLMRGGTTPTVAQAAEAALVSRTTAYRYFPTQDSLLLELALGVEVDEIEQLVRQPPPGVDPAEHVVDVLVAFNRWVIAHEVEQRTVLRGILDRWLALAGEPGERPPLREGRRVRWYSDTMAPLRDQLPPAAFERLVAALSLVSGVEGITALHDVCQLDDDDALDVTEWAARALVRAALAEAGPAATEG